MTNPILIGGFNPGAPELHARANPRVDHYLSLWARWMRYGTDLGYPHRTPGMAPGGSVKSFGDLEDQAAAYACRTLQGIISSLTQPHQQAVYSVWLGERWPPTHPRLAEIYAETEPMIEAGLTRWGLA